MIALYLLLAMVLSTSLAVTSLLLGSSLWITLQVYIATGSVVLIVTPILVMTAQLIRPTRDVASNSIKPLRVLAVDDDPFVCDVVTAVSKNIPYCQASIAASAKEAIDLLSKPECYFDYFLLDINMPDMDGIELCRHIRAIQNYKTAPILMLTASRQKETMQKAFLAGATDYTTKPFDIHDLTARLQSARSKMDQRHESDVNPTDHPLPLKGKHNADEKAA